MKNDKYWQRFLTTGSVEDYLKYKQNEKMSVGDGALDIPPQKKASRYAAR